MTIIDIPSGEKLQQIADIYVGIEDDFNYNPYIQKQKKRQLNINNINEQWNNPSIIFCYGDRLGLFSEKSKFIENNCVIIIGNSDYSQTFDNCKEILESNKVIHIFCQNLDFKHHKASFIPIGIANKQWNHGNIQNFYNLDIGNLHKNKTNNIFCSFSIETNKIKRQKCINCIDKYNIKNQQFNNQINYLKELSESKFAICPDGNGISTHRFWECIWTQTIPIVTRSILVEEIQNFGIPCVIIDDWSKFDINDLPDYNSFIFDDEYFKKISFKYYHDNIISKVPNPTESLNIVLSFIGKMPPYIIECVKQLRLFFNDNVYIIYSDIDKELKDDLLNFNVTLIDYNLVVSERFNNISKYKNFHIVPNLTGREDLFKLSYERFYILYELMKLLNLKNVWFMEIDILLYVNPNIFLRNLINIPYAYCYHRPNEGNTATFYVKNHDIMFNLLELLDNYTGPFISEMHAFGQNISNNESLLLLPLIFPNNMSSEYWLNYGIFDNYIFDAAVIGQYLFGLDPLHTQNLEEFLYKFQIPSIGITKYIFEWHKNENGLYLPYIKEHEKGPLIPIANLHIHSKNLIKAVSYTDK